MNRPINALAISIAALFCTTSLTFAEKPSAPTQPGGTPSMQGHMSRTPSNDERAVARAADGFYKALNQMFTGDLTPMKQVWSHENDVTYMGPGGGFQTGWLAVRAEFQKQADMRLGGKVGPTDMVITAGATIAIVNDYERGENTNADGKTETVSLRATSMFRKEHDVWKMIGHHTDTLPYLKQ
jgi:ketosteroid isomerase-like protein